MSKEIKKVIEKTITGVVVSLLLIFGFKWWLDSFEGKTRSEMNILSEVKDMEEKTLEDIEEKFGKAKEVHKQKVFTYKDGKGSYDFLIDNKVKSVVVKFKVSAQMSEIEELFDEMGMKVSLDFFNEGVVKEGKRYTKGYDVGDIEEFEIIKNEHTHKIEAVKIKY